MKDDKFTTILTQNDDFFQTWPFWVKNFNLLSLYRDLHDLSEILQTCLKSSKLVWNRSNWSKLGQIGPTIFNFSGQNFAEGRKSILEFLLTYMVIIFFRLHDRHLWSAAQTSSDLKLPTESDSDSINDYAGGFVCKYSTLPIAKHCFISTDTTSY